MSEPIKRSTNRDTTVKDTKETTTGNIDTNTSSTWQGITFTFTAISLNGVGVNLVRAHACTGDFSLATT